VVEFLNNGSLIGKTGLKEWQTSAYSNGDIQCRISGFGPITFSGTSFNTSNSYGVVISGLRKKAG
jgi:hypothetical protein